MWVIELRRSEAKPRLTRSEHAPWEKNPPSAGWIDPLKPTRPERHFSRNIFPTLYGVLLGVPLVAWLLTAPAPLACVVGLALWLLGDWLIALAARLWFGRRVAGSSERPLDIPEFADGTHSYCVELDVRYGRAIIGTDRGRLWFEEDALCFTGERTSFALTRDLVDFLRLSVANMSRGCRDRSCEIPLVPSPLGSKWSIHLDSLTRAPLRRSPGFMNALERLELSVPFPEVRQLPPLVDGPGGDAGFVGWLTLGVIHALVRVGAVVGLCFWFLYSMVGAGCTESSSAFIASLMVSVVMACVVECIFIRSFWSPIRDLVRSIATIRDLHEARRLTLLQ